MVFSLRKRTALFVVLVFLCGVLAGAVATNLWVHRGPRIGRAQADSRSLSRRQRAVDRFTRQLHLTPEQVAQLNAILDETRNAYREHELEIERLRQEGNARIREILNDAQKAQFDEMLARRERRRERRPDD